MTHRTQFLAYDLVSGTRLGEIPYVGPYTTVLDGAGILLGTVDLGGTSSEDRIVAADIINATRPRRTVIWVDRDGQLRNAYIVWGRQIIRGTRAMVLRGASLFSYFHHRRLRVTKSYSQQDQLAIAKDLIDYAQSQPGGDIGIVTESASSGVLRDRKPIGYDYEAKVIGTLIEQLAAVQNGFDFDVTCAYVNDVPTATFRTYYPRRGRTADANGISFVWGRNLLDIDVSEDESDHPNTVLGIGAGEDSTQLEAPAVNTAELDQGYPLLEAAYVRKNIYEADTLADNAAADLRRRQDSTRYRLYVDPDHILAPLGAWVVGDDVRVVIPAGGHPRFPTGLDVTLRIVEESVTPNPSGGPDEVVLTMRRRYGP